MLKAIQLPPSNYLNTYYRNLDEVTSLLRQEKKTNSLKKKREKIANSIKKLLTVEMLKC